jgi:acyl-CoA synthetase (NDP forming)
VIRVESVEEAVVTAALVAHTGPLRAPGVALVSYSGGGCELVCDRAEGAGVSLPALSSDTVAALRRALPRVPRPQNPLDLAGSFVHRPAQFEKALAIAAADPSVGITAAIMEASPGCETLFGFVARGLRATDRPGIMVTSSSDPAPPEIREQLAAVGIPFVAYGIDHAVKALGHAAWWSGRVRCAVAGAAPLETCEAAQPASDREVMGHLSAHGVPVAPALLCRTPAEALRAAMAFGRGPLALKVSSPDITHKTDAGGVRLDLQGDAVASAFDDLVATVRRARPDARIEGVLAYPMRPRGVELFVGTRCDPQWGCTIAVGLGGIWVEALADTAVELLPVSVAQVVEMLRSLRGAALLDGYRGAPAVDLEAVAQVVVKIGEAARALGPGLAALEVNPLWARGAKVEALDARILWVDEAAAAAARAKMWLPPPLSDPRAGDQSG